MVFQKSLFLVTFFDVCLFSYIKTSRRAWQITKIVSIEQSPFREDNSFSANQEIPAFYGTVSFITVFTRAHHLSVSRSSSVHAFPILRGGADKSLARPGRKQATATKLGIYSTYSPRSSIRLCFNFCKSLKKKIRRLSVQPGLRAEMISASVQGTGDRQTGPDPENRVGDQDIGSPGRPFSSELQVSGEPGHCRARTRPPWWHSRGRRFSFKMPFSCNSRDE